MQSYSSSASQIGLGAFGEEKVIKTRWIQSCISKPATVFREQKCRKRRKMRFYCGRTQQFVSNLPFQVLFVAAGWGWGGLSVR